MQVKRLGRPAMMSGGKPSGQGECLRLQLWQPHMVSTRTLAWN